MFKFTIIKIRQFSYDCNKCNQIKQHKYFLDVKNLTQGYLWDYFALIQFEL